MKNQTLFAAASKTATTRFVRQTMVASAFIALFSSATPSMAVDDNQRTYTETEVKEQLIDAAANKIDFYSSHLEATSYTLDVKNRGGFTLDWVELTSTCYLIARQQEREQIMQDYAAANPVPQPLTSGYIAWLQGLMAALADYPEIKIEKSHRRNTNVMNRSGYEFAGTPWVSSWKLVRHIRYINGGENIFKCQDHTIKVKALWGKTKSTDFGFERVTVVVRGTTQNVRLEVNSDL